jgi:predicted O-methyltransferase YrrM
VTAGGSSIPEVHRLLRVLAAGRSAAEIGTAFGDGAAAIASTAASLVTVELDPARAAVARERLPENVIVLEGDWHDLLDGPFEFVFVDGGGQETKSDPAVIELGAPGAIYLLDDMTPGWPGPDPVRELWLGDPRLAAVEILTTPETSAIVATRIG